jgi:UDPglucose 6-dehydrogenase
MNITIIGSGYVGLVSAACFADLGNNVLCLDVDKKKIQSLQNSKIPFYEPGLSDLVSKTIASNNLKFDSTYKEAISFSDVLFICVGTPQYKNGNPNLKYLKSCINSIVEQYKKEHADKLLHLFIKSTIAPGTIKKLQKKIQDHGLEKKLLISSNPEFLKEGDAINDFLKPDRIVIGSNFMESIKVAETLYRPICWKSNRVQIVTPESAEIIKYASNAFLATKISFINEIARLSDAVGADIEEIRKGIGADERINPNFLYAGIGFGGSCFPKDVSGLAHTFKKFNVDSELTHATLKTNKKQTDYFAQKIQVYYGKNLKNKQLAVWGLSFKPNTDDIRESKAIELIKKLSPKVKTLMLYDPIATNNAKAELLSIANIQFHQSAKSALRNSNGLILCTEWKEFWSPSMDDLSPLKEKVIFDGRNIMDKNLLIENGFSYIGIGK